jgi:Lysylphosphatidylglycerol synthase TM region
MIRKMSTRRPTLSQLLPIAVSAGVLVWLLRDIDLPAVVAAVDARVAAVMIPALVAFCAVTLWIEAVSIHRLVAKPPSGFGLWAAARIKCASYLPGLIHYTLGLGGLAVLLRRRTGLSLGEALGLVLLISSTDLIVALAAAGASAAMLGVGHRGVRTGLIALVIALFFAAIALVRSPRPLGALERLRGHSIFDGLRRVSLAQLAELFTMRALFSACFVAGCASAFAAFDIAPPPARLIGGIMIVALVAALPIAVAGLGTSQAAFVYLFSDDAPAARLLAMSLVLSFGIITLRAAMGVCFARELTREALHDARIAEV